MTTSEIDTSFNNPSIARPTLRYGRPAPQHISQRVTLRVADLFAAFPCLGIENAIPDGRLDTVSKFARVERVNFPTAVTGEPTVARVLAFIPRAKGWQRGQLLFRRAIRLTCT